MPHVNSSGGDDLASTDEVKVYKDEGEEEKRSSENLSEDKLGLVTESEEVRIHARETSKSFRRQSFVVVLCVRNRVSKSEWMSSISPAKHLDYSILVFLCFQGKSSDIEGRSYPDEKGSSGPQDGRFWLAIQYTLLYTYTKWITIKCDPDIVIIFHLRCVQTSSKNVLAYSWSFRHPPPPPQYNQNACIVYACHIVDSTVRPVFQWYGGAVFWILHV